MELIRAMNENTQSHTARVKAAHPELWARVVELCERYRQGYLPDNVQECEHEKEQTRVSEVLAPHAEQQTEIRQGL
jgi:hypothetical protein